MSYTYPITIHHLYISPGHNYFGHKGNAPGLQPTYDLDSVEVEAGAGLIGDRFHGRGTDFDGHVTFFAWEVYQRLVDEGRLLIASPAAFRRNVIVAGVPLNGLIDAEFAIDGVDFRGTKHCAPCRWMDQGAAVGALQLLKGRGGLRAQALSNGYLHRGNATLTTDHVLDLTAIVQPLPRPHLP